eukprot:scaffold4120_cov400-Prasinococcus_capsulatus_cf.AAC.19
MRCARRGRTFAKTPRQAGRHVLLCVHTLSALTGYGLQQIDPKQAEAAYEQGLNQLELVKRQATVYSLFAAPLKSIMDK